MVVRTHLFVDSITLVGTKLWSAKHIDEFQCRSWWTLDRIKEQLNSCTCVLTRMDLLISVASSTVIC